MIESNENFHQEWRIKYIVASICLSFLGTYTTTTLSEQYRVSQKMKNTRKGYFYLISMAFSTGGVAIWSMHFVGMGSLILKNRSSNVIMTQYFDVVLTVISLISSLLAVFFGIYIASFDTFYRKEPHEIFTSIVERGTQRLSMANIQNPYVLWALTLFSDLQLIIIGGLITGFGVCLMHYLGMMSMTVNMSITWNTSIVSASVIIACVASIVANWILFRLLALYPKRESLRIISALIMCLAVSGMHYTGMMAATYYPLDTSREQSHRWDLPLIPEGYLHSDEAIFIALTFGLSLSWFLIMIALADLRAWHYSLTHGLNESRKLVMSMSRGSRFDEDRLLKQSIDLGAQHDRMNESKLMYRLKSRPPSSINEYPRGERSSHDPEGDAMDVKRQSSSQILSSSLSTSQSLGLKKKTDSNMNEDYQIQIRTKNIMKISLASAGDGLPSAASSPTNGLHDESVGSGRDGRGNVENSITRNSSSEMGTHEISIQSKRKSSRSSKIFPVDDDENENENENEKNMIENENEDDGERDHYLHQHHIPSSPDDDVEMV